MAEPFILLINPWIYDFAAYDLWVKPLGLLYIASVIKKNGFGVHLIDCLDPYHPKMVNTAGGAKLTRKETGRGHFYQEQVEKPAPLKGIINRQYKRYGITPAVIEQELALIPKPDVICVSSMMTYWYPGVFEVIRLVKTHHPEVPVILGGIYATLCNEHAKKLSKADIVISAQGECKALRIISDLTGKYIDFTPDLTQLDTIPYPAYELLSSRKALPILTARGCPFKCTYCASSQLTPQFIRRNPSRVVDEVEYFVIREGTTDFAFYDDAFLYNPEEHAVPILKEIIKRKLKVRFHFPNGLHIRYITHAIAELMVQAGCKTIRLGLETAETVKQISTGGKVSTDDFIKAAYALKTAGFTEREVGVYILAGLPGQDVNEVYKTIQLVKEQGLKPLIAEYSPIPGTALWQMAITVSPFPIAEEPLFHNNTLLPCQWEKFTISDLELLKKTARS
jgi:radical SAM superfamily enzyme YgiQ (UPF0313 family)